MSSTAKLVAAGVALLFLIALVVAGIAAYGVIQRMNQVIADQQEIIKGEQDIIKSAREKEVNIESQRKSTVQKIEQSRKAVSTPEQAVKALPLIIPGLTPQLLPSQNKQDIAEAQKQGTPVKVVAELPIEQLQILKDFAYACQECKVNLDAATQHNAEDDKQIVALNNQVTSLNKEVQAAKGGTFFDKLKHNAKVIGVSVLIGVAIGAAAL